ncbi:MAG: sigma-70 family RNA polymerase sigma factor [Pseudomonadota bacterium]
MTSSQGLLMHGNPSDAARQRRFETLVGEHRDDLFRYAYWLSKDPALAEDVVQDAMLRAWKSLDSLREDQAAKPWLLTIVRRENARFFERKRLETVDIDELVGAPTLHLATEQDTDTDDMRAAIFALDADYREPLALQVLMGHSTKEIAEIMGLSNGAVLTRLHRARKKLIDDFDLGESE